MTELAPLALIPSALFAGFLMFLAPCTLPIVPGYLAFIAGIPEDAASVKGARKRIVWNALAFVIGFSIVFILLGTFAGYLGTVIGPWRDTLGRLAGAILITFGLTMLGFINIPALSSSANIRLPHFIVLGRWESSLLVGMLFAFGWSPCIGPILGTILLYASTSSTTAQGALLLGVFSIGLAIPFMLTAFFLERASRLLGRLTLLVKIATWAGGLGLIFVGALMVLGQMAFITSFGLNFFDAIYRPLLQYM